MLTDRMIELANNWMDLSYLVREQEAPEVEIDGIRYVREGRARCEACHYSPATLCEDCAGARAVTVSCRALPEGYEERWAHIDDLDAIATRESIAHPNIVRIFVPAEPNEGGS